ncbi:MAG: hypothetical protein QOJ98_3305, partial [Acidobacteriota bacterium]|nr:hypothetical protein [Acidobacteriota bacterium]
EAPPLQLTINATEVRIGNVTAGAEVVVLVASVEGQGGVLRHRSGAKTFRDDDGDGVVTFADDRGIPLRSVWVAVDIETGRIAIASPADFPLQSSPLPDSLLDRDGEGVIGVFELQQRNTEMLLVRPKSGAWRLRAHEGGNGDGDKHANGKLRLDAADAIAVFGDTPPPKRLKKGDVIAVIDPVNLDVMVGEVEE